jgi:hypothetical protein
VSPFSRKCGNLDVLQPYGPSRLVTGFFCCCCYNYRSCISSNIVQCSDTSVTCLQVILTPTCRVSGYPRQVIKVATLLRRLRFIWTALPTVITLITIIPLGTYTTSSWYIFFPDDATPLVHLSSLMSAVCLSLLTRLLHWTASFIGRFLFYSGLLASISLGTD